MKIYVTIAEDNIIGAADHLDVPTSMAFFRGYLEHQLEKRFPRATVIVLIGAEQGVEIEYGVEYEVERAIDMVWTNMPWAVEKEVQHAT